MALLQSNGAVDAKVRGFFQGLGVASAILIFTISSGTALAETGAISDVSRNVGPLVEPYYPGDRPMWDRIFREKNTLQLPPGDIEAAIVPHHDLMILEISQFWQSLAKSWSPSVVVIVSPDHFERGEALITFPRSVRFDTTSGILSPDYATIDQLLQDPALYNVVSASDLPWPAEHGIFMHAPFVARLFPRAKFIPIIVRPCATDDDFSYFRTLAETLHTILPPDSLVIASVDFSHYQINAVADLHDSVSASTIYNGEDPRFLEVDSPESLTVAMRYAELRGASRRFLVARTTSASFNPDPLGETTSHQYWAFYQGTLSLEDNPTLSEVVPPDNPGTGRGRDITILLAGSGSPGAGIREYWRWDRYGSDPDPAVRILSRLAGKEARFLSGFDALIFDPAVAIDTVVSKHGTKLRVVCPLPREETTAVGSVLGVLGESTRPSIPPRSGEINIAVLDMTLWQDLAREEETRLLLTAGYDVIVEQDPSGMRPATATVVVGSEKIERYDLGICFRPGVAIKGAVLALDWNGEYPVATLFGYASENGYPPAIHQFGGE